VTDEACPQHPAPRRRACGEQESQCPNRVRPVRPLDEASLTIRKTTSPDTSPRLSPARGHGRRMTNGTFTNTYLVGRKTVPFVTAPAAQDHSDRRRTGDQHMRKGLIALTVHLAYFYLGRHPPNHLQSPPLKRASRLRPASPPQPENQQPTERQDVQINYLDILAIFVKQTTYLAILPLFGHLAPIWSPCPIAPGIREIRDET
jgi:hypothetical protein